MRKKRKKKRGRKRDQIWVSEGFKEFVREEKSRIKKKKGVEPSEEEIILGRMDVDEEEIFQEDKGEPDFMNLF